MSDDATVAVRSADGTGVHVSVGARVHGFQSDDESCVAAMTGSGRSTYRRLRFARKPRTAVVLLAACLLVQGCIGSAVTVKGEIRDDGITLERGDAPAQVRYELRNVGQLPCVLVAGYTSLSPDALPVRDGRVVLTEDGGPDAVVPDLTYERPPDYTLGRVAPGATGSFEVALTGPPATGERVIFCNAVGDYERGRYALLAFER